MDINTAKSVCDKNNINVNIGINNITDKKPIMTKLDDEKHGFEKNKMIASIVNYIYPEYKKQLPVLNNIDLTPETVFKQSFPPIPNELNPSTNQFRIKQAEKLTNNITYPDNNTHFHYNPRNNLGLFFY